MTEKTINEKFRRQFRREEGFSIEVGVSSTLYGYAATYGTIDDAEVLEDTITRISANSVNNQVLLTFTNILVSIDQPLEIVLYLEGSGEYTFNKISIFWNLIDADLTTFLVNNVGNRINCKLYLPS